MCGIAGYWTGGKVDPALLVRMEHCLAHRGPDDHTIWSDTEAGIGFAHRRLAIVDLSPSGRQPMGSNDGRWMLSFNGEIYNHPELRSELESAGRVPVDGWRGHSDTEVLVEAVAAWGLERALAKSVGMFALSLWDRQERRLSLARDRFGEKPLYYGRCARDFVFGSELKALRVHPEFDATIDREALSAYAALTVIPAPLSIYRDIHKLPPATILTLDQPGGEPRLAPYWSYRDVVMEGLANPFDSEAAAIETLDGALRTSLAGQAMADVPVGAFLSGGIDSSIITAFYQAVSGTQVKTFSIGFEEAGFDESADARRVAEHLGTDHHEHRVGVAEAQAVIPMLPTIYDEPFADSSQIPTYLVSKFARQQVTVAITGDGGDELFAGYNRHILVPRFWNRLEPLSAPLRRFAFGAAALAPDWVLETSGRVAGLSRQLSEGSKIRKFARVAASASNVNDVIDSFLDEWHGKGSPVRGQPAYRRAPGLSLDAVTGCDITAVTYTDTTGYLTDDILAKVDRASMAVSLETRVPFLDHRVAAAAARVPPEMKVSGGRGKQILRKLLESYVPRPLVDRPKAGFAVPVGQWIRGPLRDWAEDLLDPKKLEQAGYFDAKVVRRRWESHLKSGNSTPAIWSVLMFQAWLLEQR